MGNRLISPWHEWLAETKWNAYVNMVAGLDITAVAVATPRSSPVPGWLRPSTFSLRSPAWTPFRSPVRSTSRP